MKDLYDYPTKASIEIVRTCNLKCPVCPVGNGKAKRFPMMKKEKFNYIISLISGHIKKVSLFNYGEPLLHPEIASFIKIAKNAGIPNVIIHSNGQLLTEKLSLKLIESGLNQLVISVEAINQKTYEKYRKGGNFIKLLHNLKKLQTLKTSMKTKEPNLTVQFIISSCNEASIKLFDKMLTKLMVDEIKYKTFNANMDLSNNPKFLTWVPKNEVFSRYFDSDKRQRSTKTKDERKICKWPRKILIVNADGTVVPCCQDYNNISPLGFFDKKSDKTWWKTQAREKFIANLYQNPDSLNPCINCQNSSINLSREFVLNKS